MLKNTFRVVALAGVLLASGCASVPIAPATQDAELKTFAAPPADMGVFVGGANVELVPEDEGRKGVLASKLAK